MNLSIPRRCAALLLPMAFGLACSTSQPADSVAPAPPAPLATGAQPIAASTSAAPKEVAASAERLLEDVRWLAADEREGRRAGTPAEERVAQWLAARFQSLKLEPAGVDGGYLQPFQVPLPARAGEGTKLRSQRAGEIGKGELVPLSSSANGSARGQLVFAGYGIVDADLKRDDYASARSAGGLEGAIVLVVRGTPPFEPERPPPAEGAPKAEGWGNAASLIHKVMTAKRMGAAAVLVALPPGEKGSVPAFDPGQTGRASIPALFVSAQAARALIPDYDARVARLNGGAPQAAEGLEPDTLELTADVRRETGTAYNVLARLPGERAQRTIVIGAHFDHLGLGGEGSLAPGAHGEVHNGADDNASGTAAVLELARVLAAGPRPQADLVFALWSGEELGLLGSEHWVQQPTLPLERVAAKINLDMVGRAHSNRLAVLGAGSAEPFAEWIRAAGAKARLDPTVSLSGQGVGGSDHQTFLRKRIPSVHLFTGLHTDYHRPSDDAVRFEADGTRQVVEFTRALVQPMAAGAASLAYVEPPAQEQGAAQRMGAGWRVWFGSVPQYGYDGAGVLLAGTSAGSPAEKAGLMEGDVLVQVGDVKLDTIQDFMYALQIHKPGDVVVTRFLRQGEVQEVRMTLGTRDAQ